MISRNRMKSCLVVFILYAASISSLFAEVRLPKVFSDNMVLQREKELNIWGWAEKGETVKIDFNGQSVTAKADKKGNWKAIFQPMTFGGPYEMKISGKADTKTLKNLLIGDVWLCSGQSNMEWKLINTDLAEEEIAHSENPKIRIFTVEKTLAFSPTQDISNGVWKECNAENVKEFSAVAYYFGKELQQELGVPIGLLASSWGGTNIEAWMPWDEMLKFEEYKNFNLKKQGPDSEENKQNQQKYLSALKKDRGVPEKWFSPEKDFSSWKTMELPGSFERSELGIVDGIVWFSREFEIPPTLANQEAIVSLGGIDDEDETYINGKLVGTASGWNKKRIYTIAPEVLKEGKNRIVIKVTDHEGGGGITGKPSHLFFEVGDQKIPLAGEWKFKPSVLTSDFKIITKGPNSFPSQLFNAMIAPLINFPIKGVIWYQGESNTFKAFKYRDQFTSLIQSWRKKWADDFPFFWVQLANYMTPVENPKESDWAELRESQSSALKLPNTGQAVIIDIGEAEDIHPRNKKDVGHRLALNALKMAYGKELVYSGPVYESMAKVGNKVYLNFSSTEGGMVANDKYGYLKGFSIAGEDKKFVWAKAYIEDGKVVVFSKDVANPVAVRYAWANNPDDANFYNKEGLPASPFRTDSWRGITEGR